jgi:serine-type D-Ala-D-Ala carboxypeptidase/endopeptidase (penicillin-binding protein 4)
MLQKHKVNIPFWLFFSIITFSSCNISKKIGKQAEKHLLKDSSLLAAHVGICIYEPATGKYWYNHQADKYFIPASNTKIFTCYAGMKYLGDSLPALRVKEENNEITIQGTGDPTLLQPAFKYQPVYDYLKNKRQPILLDNSNWKDNRYGSGWSWDDFGAAYFVERCALPVYGNIMRFYLEKDELKFLPYYRQDIAPAYPMNKYPFNPSLPYLHIKNLPPKFGVKRASLTSNLFTIYESENPFKEARVAKQVDEFENLEFLKDSLYHTRYGTDSVVTHHFFEPNKFNRVIRSQPTDSLLKPMMHRSDNFFAEQTLLMVSNEQLGYMNTAAIVDTILKTDFKEIPQKPKWVDGSGLSRYNLFTPQSIVWVLNKMKDEFGMERTKNIFATGGEGTISNYYLEEKGFIFAKTGTLSNHCALSGFLITKKGKLLIFSVLTGSYPGEATQVRRAVERFLVGLREGY